MQLSGRNREGGWYVYPQSAGKTLLDRPWAENRP